MFQRATRFSVFKSLTGAVLFGILLLAFASPRYDWLSDLDGGLFSIASMLLSEPGPANDIKVVQLPDNIHSDASSQSALRQLLKKLKKSKAAAVAVVLDPLPMLDYQRPSQSKSKSKSTTWQLTGGESSKLAWAFENYNALAGIATKSQQTGFYAIKAIKKEESFQQNYAQLLPDILLPERPVIHVAVDNKLYPFDRLPFATTHYSSAAQPLIWQDPSGQAIYPDLVLSLYAKLQRKKNISWHEGAGIELGRDFIKTDFTGRVLEYYSSATGRDAQSKVYSLNKALRLSSRTFRNKIIIAGSNAAQLTALSNRLNSLVSGAVYYTPSWSQWLNIILLVVVYLYLLMFLVKLQKYTGLLLSLLLIFIGLVFQYGLFLTQGVWLSLTAVYVFMMLGYLVVQLKRSADTRINRLNLQTHEALWQLGSYQFDKGDHDQALPTLLKCKPTSDVLALLYEIGLGYERRRQYEKALRLFTEISVRNKDFKDVKKRLQTLTGVSGAQTEVLSPSQHAKTLVMPQMDLQLPVLGRYEIERELGRGAMGVVYLGKDPKINRQVAIKTLDYSQLSENEIKTIKSRFFREAEAAGRLSHPNIVTVYDVGDEEDFAFIAMDYVPGVSLGEHTKKEKLLPVSKVYKLIAQVAETLDYAHSQNIVHRDIKPGNLMYNPDDGSVKITDFGIARITDSVRTRTGSFMGSPSYMAPEQMTGTNVDGHADIYALGVSFYQLLTGVLPFAAESLGTLAYKIAHDKHRPIRDVRDDLPSSATRIINKALQKKPDKRFASGKEMAEALRRGMPKGGED